MVTDELSPEELAAFYVAQTGRFHRGEVQPEGEPSALWVWEALISNDPERAWPVFVEIVALQPDDETLQQVSHRVRLLLHGHYDAFHARVAELLRTAPRLARIAGRDVLDERNYREQPLDIEQLIVGHRRMHEAATDAHRVQRLWDADPERTLPIAIEIIHRGSTHGMDVDRTKVLLQDLLIGHGELVIDRVETIARDSYLVRRALWEMRFRQRATPLPYRINDEVWPRVAAATAGTTDWSDDETPSPEPRTLPVEDERLIAAWFEYEQYFWAFETMGELVSTTPEEAWPIFLRMLEGADEGYVGSLSAGPLEDLLHGNGALLIDRIAAEARHNEKLRDALTGVYLWNSEIFPRYLELMKELGLPAIGAPENSDPSGG
jgi:hypothetical protein